MVVTILFYSRQQIKSTPALKVLESSYLYEIEWLVGIELIFVKIVDEYNYSYFYQRKNDGKIFEISVMRRNTF